MLDGTCFYNICSMHTTLIVILHNKKLSTGPMHKGNPILMQSIKHIETMLRKYQANNIITLSGIQDN